MQTSIYLSLGSNLGNRDDNLRFAIVALTASCGNVIAASSIYKTAAWGKTDQPDFLNQVVEMESELLPAQLLTAILKIEEQMGRVRTERWSERIIDIDILFYNTIVINVEGLSIPHPALPQRRFILVPLNEIAPDLRHPVLIKKVKQLLEECEDGLQVVKFT